MCLVRADCLLLLAVRFGAADLAGVIKHLFVRTRPYGSSRCGWGCVLRWHTRAPLLAGDLQAVGCAVWSCVLVTYAALRQPAVRLALRGLAVFGRVVMGASRLPSACCRGLRVALKTPSCHTILY